MHASLAPSYYARRNHDARMLGSSVGEAERMAGLSVCLPRQAFRQIVPTRATITSRSPSVERRAVHRGDPNPNPDRLPFSRWVDVKAMNVYFKDRRTSTDSCPKDGGLVSCRASCMDTGLELL
jgi:hypothetical protein